jgi:hypothetical protein
MITRFLALAFCLAATLAARGDDAKPAGDPPPDKKITRMYDIRGWLSTTYDLSLDSSPHATAFVTPANQPTATFDYRDTGQRVPSRATRNSRTRDEQVETLVKLVMDSIDPESWVDNGGRYGSIRDLNGILVITQTAANQKKAADILKELTTRQGETVHTYADWLILPHSEVSKLLKPQSAGEKENHVAPSLDPAALAKLPPTVRHFRAELLCLNGQTVSYVSGRERTVTVGEIAVMGTEVGAFQPIVGNAGTGIALQVNPTIDRTTGKAVVTLFSTFNDPENPGAPIPVRIGTPVYLGPTSQPSAQRVGKSETSASYRAVNGVVQEFRTTLKMPIGIPTLVSSMTLEPTAKNAEAMELVMILSVHPAE